MVTPLPNIAIMILSEQNEKYFQQKHSKCFGDIKNCSTFAIANQK